MSKFNELVKSNRPVLIDFYADWCGPCKAMAPVLKEVSQDSPYRILKIDVDKNPKIAQKYNIRSIPTIMIFRQGKVQWRHSGTASKAQLINELDRVQSL